MSEASLSNLTEVVDETMPEFWFQIMHPDYQTQTQLYDWLNTLGWNEHRYEWIRWFAADAELGGKKPDMTLSFTQEEHVDLVVANTFEFVRRIYFAHEQDDAAMLKLLLDMLVEIWAQHHLICTDWRDVCAALDEAEFAVLTRINLSELSDIERARTAMIPAQYQHYNWVSLVLYAHRQQALVTEFRELSDDVDSLFVDGVCVVQVDDCKAEDEPEYLNLLLGFSNANSSVCVSD